jgi:hypothetical protein
MSTSEEEDGGGKEGGKEKKRRDGEGGDGMWRLEGKKGWRRKWSESKRESR